MVWPITDAEVTGYLGVSPAGAPDSDALQRAAAAAVQWVTDHVLPSPPPAEPSASIELGTIMLAARWYNRRTSPQGIASFADLGVSYVIRHDPDVARLLGLGKPAVG